MKKLDTYLNLCTEVYDLSKPNSPEDAFAFYRDYARNANGLILEPMCGTGRFLLPLIEEGFEIHGFDASEHMLHALNTKAKLKNIKPKIWSDFTESFQRQERYKLIFIPSGSFCLITNLSAIKLTLKNFYDHLEYDGILLFEIETENSIPPLGIWRGSKWDRSDNKYILLSQCAWLNDSVCSSIGKYELISDNQIIHTEIEAYKIKLYKRGELKALLLEAGFKNIRILKAYNKTALPDPNDESIIYECIK